VAIRERYSNNHSVSEDAGRRGGAFRKLSEGDTIQTQRNKRLIGRFKKAGGLRYVRIILKKGRRPKTQSKKRCETTDFNSKKRVMRGQEPDIRKKQTRGSLRQQQDTGGCTPIIANKKSTASTGKKEGGVMERGGKKGRSQN